MILFNPKESNGTITHSVLILYVRYFYTFYAGNISMLIKKLLLIIDNLDYL